MKRKILPIYLSVNPELEDGVELHMNKHVGWRSNKCQWEIEQLYVIRKINKYTCRQVKTYCAPCTCIGWCG